jgi:hypothetical protein
MLVVQSALCSSDVLFKQGPLVWIYRIYSTSKRQLSFQKRSQVPHFVQNCQ